MALPIVLGLVMVLTLSRWSSWSRKAKAKAAIIYAGVMVLGSFAELFIVHDWPGNIGIQMRSGTFAAFRVSLLRLSATWKGRLGGSLSIGLCLAILRLRYS